MKLRSLARYAAPIPVWATIGLAGEQQLIDVELRCGGRVFGVNGNHVVVSLVPLIVAVGQPGLSDGQLVFIDRSGGRELAVLDLRATAIEPVTAEPALSFFEVTRATHRCLPPGVRSWQRLVQANWHHDGGFRMSNTAIQQLMLFYLCPRPVVLVSVDDGENNNLFPMDLIGKLGGYFSLALRTSSPSVATMRNSRRLALAEVALDRAKTVYALGKHHKIAKIQWGDLPFRAARSPEFGLPIPADAQRLREVSIDRWIEVGSHSFFLCRVVSDQALGNEPRMHHTCGLHRVYRQQFGDLPWQELPSTAAQEA